jgi:glycosyltransferase involved in cell wall biosynthesis
VDFSIFRHSFLGLNRWKYVRGVDRILCVSDYVRDVLRRDGLPDALLGVVHDGIDPARVLDAPAPDASLGRALGLEPGDRVVGNVAACVGHKGQRFLVEAAPRVLEACPRARFVIVGDGVLRPELERQARDLGVADRVLFPGFREDVPTLLRLFDVFCFPSVMEGLGTSLLDAMALGLPVVSTRAGGIPEVVRDDVDGLLVEPGDAAALADALLGVLGDAGLAARLGAAARERVGAFSVGRMVAGTLAAYEWALASRA